MRKFLFIIICLIMVLALLVLLTEYVSIKQSKIDIEDTEYKTNIDNIDKLDIRIDRLKYKLEDDKAKVNNLDDSSTVQLFIELVRGK